MTPPCECEGQAHIEEPFYGTRARPASLDAADGTHCDDWLLDESAKERTRRSTSPLRFSLAQSS